MATLNWLQTLLVGATLGAVSMDAYHRYYAPSPSLPMSAAIVDAAVRLGWECHNDGTMTLDGCRQLAAGAQRVGD